MFDRGALFLGSTAKNERSFLRLFFEKMRQRYDRLAVPCAGKFGALEVAIEAGWTPEQIDASDVSLLTSVIAAYVNGVPIEQYAKNLKAEGDLGEFLDLTNPAEVLYALKVAGDLSSCSSGSTSVSVLLFGVLRRNSKPPREAMCAQ